MLLAPKTKWPASIDAPPTKPVPLGDAAAMVTAIGHSTFLIQTAAVNILTDPMYSERAGPLEPAGPAPGPPSGGGASKTCRRSALILLSHNHYDHCDRPT